MAIEKKNDKKTDESVEAVGAVETIDIVEKAEEPKKPEPKLKHLTIKLPEETHWKLKAKAALDRLNVKALMNKIVLEYVKDGFSI